MGVARAVGGWCLALTGSVLVGLPGILAVRLVATPLARLILSVSGLVPDVHSGGITAVGRVLLGLVLLVVDLAVWSALLRVVVERRHLPTAVWPVSAVAVLAPAVLTALLRVSTGP